MRRVVSDRNGVSVEESHGVLSATDVIREMVSLPPGSVYRLRKQRDAEAYTYLLVITKKEYDEWEP
jgi:hypothetical protein